MLALALRCDDKKVAKERQCYRRYIIAFEHVSPVCRLTLEDEMVLLNSRYGFSDDEDPIYKERRTMLLKVQASGRPRGGAAVLKSPDADGGGGDGETVAAALIAHRNGGAISQLFDDTYCKAKLVEAHAAFEARAPPPVPAAPFVNIASLKENVKEAFGGFSVRNDDMDVAAADERQRQRRVGAAAVLVPAGERRRRRGRLSSGGSCLMCRPSRSAAHAARRRARV